MKAAARFRMLALAVGAVVTVGAFVAAAAVATVGDRTRVFGWTAVRAGGSFVARAAPNGPAAGALRDGDRTSRSTAIGEPNASLPI